MARINPKLVKRLQSHLGLGRAAVYRHIANIVNTRHLDRHHAALVLASQSGLNIGQFATTEDLAAIRAVGNPGAAAGVAQHPKHVEVTVRRRDARPSRRRSPARRSTTVWVVHGRDVAMASELKRFLRALGLQPLEWNQALARTKQAAPYIGTVLERAFRDAAAVVVLLTPDDEARLRARLRRSSEPSHETQLTGQARPNVLFEAGMAFGKQPASTVLVRVGDVRPFSDVAGRHIVNLDGSGASRRELATKLHNAGCGVDISGSEWLSEGDFSVASATKARRRSVRRRR